MVRNIIDLGLPYNEQQIRKVLANHDYNQERATDFLLNGMQESS